MTLILLKFVTLPMGKHFLLSIFLDSFPWVKEILSNLSGFVTVLIAVGVHNYM
jgi:hypothetical protein